MIARPAEATRLLQIDQPVGAVGLLKPLGGAEHLAQLVAAVGDQQQCLTARHLLDHDGAIAGQLLGLLPIEVARPVALGHDHAGQFATRLIDRRQQRQSTVVVRRESTRTMSFISPSSASQKVVSWCDC